MSEPVLLSIVREHCTHQHRKVHIGSCLNPCSYCTVVASGKEVRLLVSRFDCTCSQSSLQNILDTSDYPWAVTTTFPYSSISIGKAQQHIENGCCKYGTSEETLDQALPFISHCIEKILLLSDATTGSTSINELLQEMGRAAVTPSANRLVASETSQ